MASGAKVQEREGGISLAAKYSDEEIIRILWLLGITTTSLLAVLVTILALARDMTDVFPHLYYIPILLAAYRYPRWAIPFAAILGAVYAGIVFALTGYDVDFLVRALIRVLVFIWVAAIIAYLAGNLQRRNSHLSAMNEIVTAASTSATLDEILSTAGKRIREIFGSGVVMVYLVEKDGARGRLRYQEAVPEGALAGLGAVDLSAPPFPQILTGGEPVHLRGGNPFGTRPLPGIQSTLAIPLSAGDRPFGLVVTGQAKAASPEKDEMAMLGSIARAVGNAVKKALLQEELAEANTKANLYLDIMSHDINNVNTVSIGYAQILEDMVADKAREILRKMEAAIQASVEIIHNVSTIRKIQEASQANRPMDLDPVIRSELDYHPDVTIHYEGTMARVCANGLLSEVFRNLVGNSAKFGGKGVELWIRVMDEGEMVAVLVEDNGPGIPDELKPRIFNRFQRGETRKSGKGLGLYICRMIVEGYGGTIRAGDRVAGEPKKGAAIRFTVPKACPA
jgi:K+-sensing histidine kinase KdpD